MLYDKARIFVQGGTGGNGVSSFRREAHVPHGGPDGGDGGRGGDVVLLCDDSLRDLQSFKRRAHYKATRARHGQGANKHGADGEDLVVKVPPGTQVVMDDGTVHDLVIPGHFRPAAAPISETLEAIPLYRIRPCTATDRLTEPFRASPSRPPRSRRPRLSSVTG